MKITLRVFCAFLLFFSLILSTATFAQTPVPAQPAVPLDPMERLFALTDALVLHSQAVCESDECKAVIAQLKALNADARYKYSKGLLVDDEKQQFHKDYAALIPKLQTALLAHAQSEPLATRLQTAKNLQFCRAAHQNVAVRGHLILTGGDACGECRTVMEEAVAICALYFLVSPVAGAICEAAAALGYSNCVARNCPAVQVPPQK